SGGAKFGSLITSRVGEEVGAPVGWPGTMVDDISAKLSPGSAPMANGFSQSFARPGCCLSNIEFVLPVSTHRRGVGIHFGTEVAEYDQRFDVAGVIKGHAGFGGVFGAENFVFGEFVEADEFG